MAEALAAAIDECPDPRTEILPPAWIGDHKFGVGIGVTPARPTTQSEVSAIVRTAVDVIRLGGDGSDLGARQEPAMTFSVELGRVGGWLVDPRASSGSSATGPNTRVRGVSAHITRTMSGHTTAVVDLIDASVYGVHRSVWPLGRTTPGDGLPAEERLLVEAVVESLIASSAPAATAVLGVLESVGIVASSTQLAQFSAVEQALADATPLGLNVDTADAKVLLVQRLSNVLGGTELGNIITVISATAVITLDFSGPVAQARVAIGDTVSVAASATSASAGLDVTVGATTGSAEITSRDAIGNSVGLVLALAQGTGAANLALRFDDAVTGPRMVELWPTPDRTGLERVLIDLLPAYFLQLLLQAIDNRTERFGALVNALNLRSDLGTVALPFSLIHHPGRWLESLTQQTESVPGQLVPAVLEALGVDGTAGIGLPWGLELRSVGSPSAGVRLELPNTGVAGVSLSGAFGFDIVAGALRLAGETRLEVRADANASGPVLVGARLVLDDSSIWLTLDDSELQLYPAAGSFSNLAAAAARALLPVALDAAATVSLGGRKPVALLGDALSLRTGSVTAPSFDQAQISALLADPSTRLQANGVALAGMAATLVADVVAGAAAAGSELSVALPAPAGSTAALTLDLGSSSSITVTAAGFRPVAGLAVDAQVVLSDSIEVTVRAEVVDAALLDVGSLSFLPSLGLSIDSATGGVSGDVGLWFATAAPRTGMFLVVDQSGSTSM
ncbi:MAG: hypothetical protein ACC652_09470, partial [Acidimicrobiales bacterium]